METTALKKTLAVASAATLLAWSLVGCGPSKPSSPSGLDGAAAPQDTATPTADYTMGSGGNGGAMGGGSGAGTATPDTNLEQTPTP